MLYFICYHQSWFKLCFFQFYHACDQPEFSYCLMLYSILHQFGDFNSSLTSDIRLVNCPHCGGSLDIAFSPQFPLQAYLIITRAPLLVVSSWSLCLGYVYYSRFKSLYNWFNGIRPPYFQIHHCRRSKRLSPRSFLLPESSTVVPFIWDHWVPFWKQYRFTSTSFHFSIFPSRWPSFSSCQLQNWNTAYTNAMIASQNCKNYFYSSFKKLFKTKKVLWHYF